LELLNKLSKHTGYKITYEKRVEFIYTSNELVEKEI
jgi:hypothetical protein